VGLSTTGDIISHAIARNFGIGAFNVIGIEHAEAIVAGAEQVRAPVLLQLSENTIRFHFGQLAPIGLACLAIARSSTVAVSVHLDHATSVELCHEAQALGITSLMFDGSTLPYDRNVAETMQVASWGHARGMWMEAELGEIGGKAGVHVPGARTNPDQAVKFVEQTRVDALAVAIGTSHAMLERSAKLDLALLARLRDAVPVPLVMHGSSGVTDDDLGNAVRAGMVKINVGTQLNQVFVGAVRTALDGTDSVDPRVFMAPGRDAISSTVGRILVAIGADTDL
jgi:fructose-bisphosphate aldolase class II